MAKYPSENTNTLRYFRTYLAYWLKKNDLTQSVAAQRLDLRQGQLNELLNGKRGISIYQIEKACAQIGVNVVDALAFGRNLSGEKSKTESLSPSDAIAIDAFKVVVQNTDKAAKMIIKNVIEYAKEKQGESEDPTVRQGFKSAS